MQREIYGGWHLTSEEQRIVDRKGLHLSFQKAEAYLARAVRHADALGLEESNDLAMVAISVQQIREKVFNGNK